MHFATLNLTKVPLYLYTGAFNPGQIMKTLWVLPLLPVGVLLDRLMSIHVKREAFEYLVLALLLVASGVMLFAWPDRVAYL